MVPVMGVYVYVLLGAVFMRVGGEMHVHSLAEQHAEQQTRHQQNREQA